MKMAIWHITTHFVVEGHISEKMTLWGNREQHRQGQQRTEKVVGLRKRNTSCSGRIWHKTE